MTTTNKPHRFANTALILSFLAIIWLPTWDSLWELDRRPALNENRKPADFPKLSPLRGCI